MTAVNPRRPHSLSTTPRWGLDASTVTVTTIIAASGIAAAFSGSSPTGHRSVDIVWCALIGILIPLLAVRARRVAMLTSGGVASVIGFGGDPATIIMSIGLLGLLLAIAASPRRIRRLMVVAGALTIQILLRGPSYGFIGLPTIVAIATVLPVCISGWRMARAPERRVGRWAVAMVAAVVLLAGLSSVGVAIRARADVQHAADEAIEGLRLLRTGDTDQATAKFQSSSARFSSASGSLDSFATWPGQLVPVVAQNLRTLQAASSSGVTLTLSAAATASTADYRALAMSSGRIDLAKVASLEGPVEDSLGAITSALEAIGATGSPWLAPPVGSAYSRLIDELSSTRLQAQNALEGIRVAPALLGADAPKRYFVSFGHPGESRNAGGFIGAYAILDANAGRLSLGDAGPIDELYRRPPLYRFDPPVDWESRYGSYVVNHNIGDHSVSPSWPVDASVIAQLYPQTPAGTPLDGAIYADPAALAGFLSLTGPITVPGIAQKLTNTNVEEYLLRGQYIEFEGSSAERKDALEDVARATFEAFTTRPLPNLAKVASTLGPLFEAGHLQVTAFEPRAETFLDDIDLSGRWSIEPGADYLSVRSTNLMANKIDTYLTRTIDVQTQVDEQTGTLRSTIHIELRNDAPAEGLPPYLIGNGWDLPNGTNRTLVSVYSPHQLQSVSVNGVPSGARVQSEFGGPVYGVVAEIPPKSTVTIDLELVGTVPSWPYRLRVLPQAMANPDHLTIRIDNGTGSSRPLFDGTLNRTVVVKRR